MAATICKHEAHPYITLSESSEICFAMSSRPDAMPYPANQGLVCIPPVPFPRLFRDLTLSTLVKDSSRLLPARGRPGERRSDLGRPPGPKLDLARRLLCSQLCAEPHDPHWLCRTHAQQHQLMILFNLCVRRNKFDRVLQQSCGERTPPTHAKQFARCNGLPGPGRPGSFEVHV